MEPWKKRPLYKKGQILPTVLSQYWHDGERDPRNPFIGEEDENGIEIRNNFCREFDIDDIVFEELIKISNTQNPRIVFNQSPRLYLRNEIMMDCQGMIWKHTKDILFSSARTVHSHIRLSNLTIRYINREFKLFKGLKFDCDAIVELENVTIEREPLISIPTHFKTTNCDINCSTLKIKNGKGSSYKWFKEVGERIGNEKLIPLLMIDPEQVHFDRIMLGTGIIIGWDEYREHYTAK